MEARMNSHPQPRIASRLRIAGVLVILGLLVEIFTLFWAHPLAFVAFIVLGCALIGLGILVYLWSLISVGEASGAAQSK